MTLTTDQIARLRARTATIATIASETGESYWAVQRAAQAAGDANTRRLLPDGPELLEMEAAGARPSEIARRYGASPSAVSHALKKAREAQSSSRSMTS